jgi:TolB-like protein
MQRYRTVFIALLFILGGWISAGSANPGAKRILVLPIEPRISDLFLRRYGMTVFTSGDAMMHVVSALRTSQAMDRPVVDTMSMPVDSSVINGFGESLLRGLDAIVGMEHVRGYVPHQYYLAGKITDDSSNILVLDAALYRRRADTTRIDPLMVEERYHIEGSRVEAFAAKKTLMDFLLDSLVVRLEVRLDDRIRVLVTPLTFYGRDEEMKNLGGMISALLRNRLNLSRSIRIIQDTASVPPVQSGNGNEQWILARTLPERGRREAARYVLTGSFFKYDTCIGLEVSQIDVESGHVVLSHSELVPRASGPKLYETIRTIGDDVRRGIELGAQSARGHSRVRRDATHSPDR